MANTVDYIYNKFFKGQTDPTPNTLTMASDVVIRVRDAISTSDPKTWVSWDDCHVLALAAAKAAGAAPLGGWGSQGQSPTSVRDKIKGDPNWYWAYDTTAYDLDWTNRAQLSQYLKPGDIIRAQIGSYNHTMTVVEVSASDIKIVDNGRKATGTVPVIEHSLFDYAIIDNTASIVRLKSSGVTYIQPSAGGGSSDPTLSVNDVQASESAGSLAFTVSLSKALDKDVTVNAYTVAQTAFASQGDYEPVNKTITIKAGTTSTSVAVPLTDDTKAEGAETIDLRLRNAKNATIGDGVGVGTILDNDSVVTTPVLPKLTVGNLSVNEGVGAANVTVSLDRVATTDVSFNATTYVGTASGTGGDYSGFTSKAGVIRAGSRSATVTVAITNDRLSESTETFQVGVFDVRNATVAQERGTVTITDNDVATIQPPKVSIGDASVTEGGNAVFSVSLDKASTSDVTLLLTTYKGTANVSGSGTDYNGFVDKKVTIRAGATSATVSVATVDDRIGEKSETFALEIAQATGATITRRRGTGTIADNDGGGFPAVSVGSPTAAADAGTGTASRFGTTSLPSADGRWLAVAAADFNGDGYADIVLRDQVGGQNAVWFMQGAERIDGAFLPDAPSLSWQIVGAADMNQDGAADLVWRNDETGENALWLMNGASRIDTVALPSTAKTEWRIGGVADLNGDESADILWRNQSTGENAVWLMEGTERLDAVALPTTSDLDWQMIGAGDINENGSADILWHNRATGATSYWAFDGLTRIETGTLGQTANFDWTAFAVADLDGSGGADILWRDPVNGQQAAWFAGITS